MAGFDFSSIAKAGLTGGIFAGPPGVLGGALAEFGGQAIGKFSGGLFGGKAGPWNPSNAYSGTDSTNMGLADYENYGGGVPGGNTGGSAGLGDPNNGSWVEGMGTSGLVLNGQKINLPNNARDPSSVQRHLPPEFQNAYFVSKAGGGGTVIGTNGQQYSVDEDSNINMTPVGGQQQQTSGLTVGPNGLRSGGGFIEIAPGQFRRDAGRSTQAPGTPGQYQPTGSVSQDILTEEQVMAEMAGQQPGFSKNEPLSPFDPRSFVPEQIQFKSPDFGEITPFIPETQGLSGVRSQRFMEQASFLEAQAGQFMEGLGALTTERQKGFDLAGKNLELGRAKALGDLGYQFERNKISGGSLRASTEASANAEYDRQKADLDVQRGESLAQSKLQELDVQTKLIQESSNLKLQAVQSDIDDSFKTAEFGRSTAEIQAQMRASGQQLFAAISAIQADIVKSQMDIAAREAQSIRAAIFGEKNIETQMESAAAIAKGERDQATNEGIGLLFEPAIQKGIAKIGGSIFDNIFGKSGGSHRKIFG